MYKILGKYIFFRNLVNDCTLKYSTTFSGTTPNVFRNGIVNISEIVCYDLVKDLLMQHLQMKDGVPCHFTSAVIAGKSTSKIPSDKHV